MKRKETALLELVMGVGPWESKTGTPSAIARAEVSNWALVKTTGAACAPIAIDAMNAIRNFVATAVLPLLIHNDVPKLHNASDNCASKQKCLGINRLRIDKAWLRPAL